MNELELILLYELSPDIDCFKHSVQWLNGSTTKKKRLKGSTPSYGLPTSQLGSDVVKS